jgi:hypothetical protein
LLTDEVKQICNRLSPHGWRDLLLAHGLDITANDLEAELLKELSGIKRNIDGFSDFAAEGKRGIEPGNPAQSLLFHALASPNVTKMVDGKEVLGAFPTLAEIEVVENYVYGLQAPTIQQLFAQREHLKASKMSIVVFATEYRPASETVHKRHADVCFSRTGICRVGNTEPLYDASRRGFLPFDENNDFAFRVLPAKYSAYLALQMDGGDGQLFGPMRFISQKVDDDHPDPDPKRKFWVPLHKLFDGMECIKGLDLKVTLKAHHVNEKIKRVHKLLQEKINGYPKIDNETLEEPPFTFTEGIAEFSTNPDVGNGLLVPIVHSKLIEVAEFQGKPLSFLVPKFDENNSILNWFSSSLWIKSEGRARHAPEFINVRKRKEKDGNITDLNNDADMLKTIRKGQYDAIHFVDFTGDGWIEASCEQLNSSIGNIDNPKFAYSLVTAPDFYPNVDQGELMEWAKSVRPPSLIDPLWKNRLDPLSDLRFPANLELMDTFKNEFVFSQEDESITAIVSLPVQNHILTPFLPQTLETMRHSYLPDAASGVFAPGWDVGLDMTPRGTLHLAAYGLGSPFPEDSKLCAALSSFWPAVAPDAGRTFSITQPTIGPLSDEEIGQSGNIPWDGAKGPSIIKSQSKSQAEYLDFDYVDYVNNMIENKFTLKLTGQVDITKYKSRILALAIVYKAVPLPLNVPEDNVKTEWNVLSFKETSIEDTEFKQAQTQSGSILKGDIYKIEMCTLGNRNPSEDFKKIRIDIEKRISIFVGSGSFQNVLLKDEEGKWRSAKIILR